jgi:LAO/AO transport system kinase
MASRGALGGLAAATWLAAAALDAAGYDPLIIETVGAGQAEVEIASLAETTVVVEVPEMGDEVQAIKAGLLEVADLIVVNKSDRPGADRAARQLKAMLSTAGGRAARPAPPVVQTTATSGEGVAALREMIDQHRAQRTDAQVRERAANLLRRAVASRAQLRAAGSDDWESAVAAVADRTEDPFAAAERLLG